MYVNLKLFFKAERLSLFGRRFRLRRWAFVFFFTGVFWTAWFLLALARAVDHVLFPGFRKCRVRRPIFIIAPPRSGTTFLQKLMCLDEEQFAHLKLYQTIFPSVLLRKTLDFMAVLDRKSGRPFSRLIGVTEKKAFEGWDDLHKLRLGAPEEDGGFLVYTLVTESIYLLFPFINELREAGFPDLLPVRSRRRLMKYYRSCLQRHLHVEGDEKTLLLKNTQICGGVEALLEEFPDARIVTILRHPSESVPSHVSLFYRAWQTHSPEIAMDSPESVAYGNLAIDWYSYLDEKLALLRDEQYTRIRYEDLVADPRRSVERIYAHFGLSMSETMRARLETATRKSRAFRSKHEYSLEDYGLSEQCIEEKLGGLIDEYALRR